MGNCDCPFTLVGPQKPFWNADAPAGAASAIAMRTAATAAARTCLLGWTVIVRISRSSLVSRVRTHGPRNGAQYGNRHATADPRRVAALPNRNPPSAAMLRHPYSAMRERFAIGPRTYFLISAVALGALTLIVFTGAAVRVTGSGLGCPSWPNCYDNGRLVAETNSHALIEFGNRTLTSFVGLAAGAAGLMAFFRRPFRRDLAILGVLLPLGVMMQAVLGGLTVVYGLAPGWVMAHYGLSMLILVAAGALAWRARPSFGTETERTADLTTTRAVWAMFVLGALTIFVGTAATAAGPHAGGSGTGDIVNRLSFRGADTLSFIVDRHGWFASALGLLAVATWWLARRRGADVHLRLRLTRICLLMALQGVIGIVQYRLKLPAEIVWVHVATATLVWVGIVLAAMQVGSPLRAPTAETA